MSLDRLMNQPLQVRRHKAGDLDPYNNPIPGWAAPVTTRGYLELAATREQTVDQATVRVDRRAWLPAGTDVGPLDQIGFEGRWYEVIGEPEDCWNPRTRSVSHIRCNLTTATEGVEGAEG